MSAFERYVIGSETSWQGDDWINCEPLTTGGTYQLNDLIDSDHCYKLDLVPASSAERSLYLSNVQNVRPWLTDRS
jgi:hypothetical protein